MKQHITIEQLRELSPAAYDKWLDVLPTTKRFTNSTTAAGETTIGQMIEFLDEHYRPAEITLRLHTGSESDGHRRRYDIFVEGPGEIEDDHLELCDALWAAVREILER